MEVCFFASLQGKQQTRKKINMENEKMNVNEKIFQVENEIEEENSLEYYEELEYIVPMTLLKILTPLELRCYCYICSFINAEEDGCLTYRTFNRVCKADRKTINKAIKKLCELGLVIATPHICEGFSNENNNTVDYEIVNITTWLKKNGYKNMAFFDGNGIILEDAQITNDAFFLYQLMAQRQAISDEEQVIFTSKELLELGNWGSKRFKKALDNLYERKLYINRSKPLARNIRHYWIKVEKELKEGKRRMIAFTDEGIKVKYE